MLSPPEFWRLFWALAALYLALVLALRMLGFGDAEQGERVLAALVDRAEAPYAESNVGTLTPTPPPAEVPDHSAPPGVIFVLTPLVWLVRFGFTRPESAAVWAALPGAVGHMLSAATLVQIWRRFGQTPGSAWSLLALLAFARAGLLWQDALLSEAEGGLVALCILQTVLHAESRPLRAGLWAGAALLCGPSGWLTLAPLLGWMVVVQGAQRRRRRDVRLFVTATALGFAGMSALVYGLYGAAPSLPPLLQSTMVLRADAGSLWALDSNATGLAGAKTSSLEAWPVSGAIRMAALALVGGYAIHRTRQRPGDVDPLLAATAFAGLSLLGLSNTVEAAQGVIGGACLLAWCGSRGTATAWAVGIGYILAQDWAGFILPPPLRTTALSLCAGAGLLVAFIGIAWRRRTGPAHAARLARETNLLGPALLAAAAVLLGAIIGARSLGFVEPTDTLTQLRTAAPDLLTGNFEAYSRTSREPLAPGVGIRIGYPPGPALLHLPYALMIRAGLLDLGSALRWVGLLSGLGELLCLWALYRVWRETGGWAQGHVAWAALGGLAFLRSAVVWHDASTAAHWEGFMAFCALQAYRHAWTHPLRAGCWAGAGLLLKTTTLLAIVPLAVALTCEAWTARGWRGPLRFAVGCMGVFAPPLVPYVLADPSDTWKALVAFPSALGIFPGTVWWHVLAWLGFAPVDPENVFLQYRRLVTPLMLGIPTALTFALMRPGARAPRRELVLGLMAFGALGLLAVGKHVRPYYGVMPVALALAYAGAVGTPKAWLGGLAFVLALDTLLAVAPPELALGATSFFSLGVYATLACVLIRTRLGGPHTTWREPVLVP